MGACHPVAIGQFFHGPIGVLSPASGGFAPRPPPGLCPRPPGLSPLSKFLATPLQWRIQKARLGGLGWGRGFEAPKASTVWGMVGAKNGFQCFPSVTERLLLRRLS